jgi:hypothetical protein
MMIADALDSLARSAQGRDGGRPARRFSDDERALVLRHWTSNRHRTNTDAVAAMLAEARERGMTALLTLDTPQAVTNFFGASGRVRVKVKGKRR